MKFQETDCSVIESVGLLKRVIVLSQPLTTDVTIQVDGTNGQTAAKRELCT